MLRSMIERPALTEGLVGRDGFVTLLAAAGAGKTTVLRQWDAADARPFVWLAPDDAAHAVALVARVAAGETGPLVIVLDDAHRHPDAAVSAIRALAAMTLPPGVAIAVSGRGIDRRSLSAVRLRPELTALSDAELALDETAAREVLGDQVDGEEMRRLLRRTRGWAAGLQLARVALGRRSDEDGPEFTGADRVVRDYLQSEVLEDLDADLTAFLLRCAPFEELTGPLCDAVRGASDSQELLEQLDRRRLFVTAVDREGRAFRWLPVVREALAAELDHRERDEARRVRTSGADWLAAHGDARTALALRLANGDREQALHLLSDVVLPSCSASRSARRTSMPGRSRRRRSGPRGRSAPPQAAGCPARSPSREPTHRVCGRSCRRMRRLGWAGGCDRCRADPWGQHARGRGARASPAAG